MTGTAASAPDRFRALVESGIALSSELTLETLLRRVVETAVALTGARYGALGVIDETGTALEQFITVGIDAEAQATIGDLPRGCGVLGVLLAERRALRLSDLSQEPRSVGFPPGHPPMRSFLGVPILLRGTVFGNLYLTEKQGGAEFNDEDEEVVRLLASQAAVAIENARLYESARRWSRQLDSLNEISTSLASEAELAKLLQLAATRLRELLDARAVLIERPSADGHDLTVEAAASDDAAQLLGLKHPRDRSKAGRALTRKRSERIDSLLDDPEVDQTVPRIAGATAALYVPLLVRERAVGVISAYDKRGPSRRFSDADMRLAEAFANRAALALELSERVRHQAVQALLEGQELERKRLARELHDETGQALTSILLGLKAVEQQIGEQPLAQIRELVNSALNDVRRLANELRPPTLDDFGLEATLERLTSDIAQRSGLNLQLNVAPGSSLLSGSHETALYRIIQEALTNIVKHAQAQAVSIIVTHPNGTVRAVIEDDGNGFDQTNVRDGALGLVGMRERAALLNGRIELHSTPGHGTTLIAELPLST